MDAAKYPAFDTKPYRIVNARTVASASPNDAPTYYLVASNVQGFPIQQAVSLVPMRSEMPTPCERLQLPIPVPKPGMPMRWYISSLLTYLGFSARLSGFTYLVNALLYLLSLPSESRYMTMEVYLQIAHQCGTTPAAVEHAIRHAVNQMWQEQNIHLYCAMSGRMPAPHEPRPTPCEFLANLLMFLRIQMGQAQD